MVIIRRYHWVLLVLLCLHGQEGPNRLGIIRRYLWVLLVLLCLHGQEGPNRLVIIRRYHWVLLVLLCLHRQEGPNRLVIIRRYLWVLLVLLCLHFQPTWTYAPYNYTHPTYAPYNITYPTYAPYKVTYPPYPPYPPYNVTYPPYPPYPPYNVTYPAYPEYSVTYPTYPAYPEYSVTYPTYPSYSSNPVTRPPYVSSPPPFVPPPSECPMCRPPSDQASIIVMEIPLYHSDHPRDHPNVPDKPPSKELCVSPDCLGVNVVTQHFLSSSDLIKVEIQNRNGGPPCLFHSSSQLIQVDVSPNSGNGESPGSSNLVKVDVYPRLSDSFDLFEGITHPGGGFLRHFDSSSDVISVDVHPGVDGPRHSFDGSYDLIKVDVQPGGSLKIPGTPSELASSQDLVQKWSASSNDVLQQHSIYQGVGSVAGEWSLSQTGPAHHPPDPRSSSGTNGGGSSSNGLEEIFNKWAVAHQSQGSVYTGTRYGSHSRN
uniref:Uncharacterized protein n=1 Tax=Timema poppense TaxID=170557 RepID=A0A7R9HCD9_TIMPO|nr:unnamed protein product [Timema poppensis]